VECADQLNASEYGTADQGYGESYAGEHCDARARPAWARLGW
jgi:hypothetical protein